MTLKSVFTLIIYFSVVPLLTFLIYLCMCNFCTHLIRAHFVQMVLMSTGFYLLIFSHILPPSGQDMQVPFTSAAPFLIPIVALMLVPLTV